MSEETTEARGSLRGIERAVDNMADRLVDLQGEVHADVERTRAVVREAVAEGIRDVLSDKEALGVFWSSAYDQLQQSATQHTGRFVITGIKAAVTKGSMFLLLGMLIYSIGGWSAVAKLWHSFWPPN